MMSDVLVHGILSKVESFPRLIATWFNEIRFFLSWESQSTSLNLSFLICKILVCYEDSEEDVIQSLKYIIYRGHFQGLMLGTLFICLANNV